MENFCWTMIEALGTWAAVIIALFAFLESNKTRKNSAFNALFAQLMANHKEAFSRKKWYSGFYDRFIRRMDDVRTIRDLCDLWREYSDGLPNDGVEFSHSFKYVYHEVVTVLKDTTIDDAAKRHYIGIIQSLMNKDELFCYLVNLLQHFENYPDESNDYRRQLREHHFFDDLLREKDERYREAMAHLCIHLYEDVGELIAL